MSSGNKKMDHNKLRRQCQLATRFKRHCSYDFSTHHNVHQDTPQYVTQIDLQEEARLLSFPLALVLATSFIIFRARLVLFSHTPSFFFSFQKIQYSVCKFLHNFLLLLLHMLCVCLLFICLIIQWIVPRSPFVSCGLLWTCSVHITIIIRVMIKNIGQ